VADQGETHGGDPPKRHVRQCNGEVHVSNG
jgi:hypothetical protein